MIYWKDCIRYSEKNVPIHEQNKRCFFVAFLMDIRGTSHGTRRRGGCKTDYYKNRTLAFNNFAKSPGNRWKMNQHSLDNIR